MQSEKNNENEKKIPHSADLFKGNQLSAENQSEIITLIWYPSSHAFIFILFFSSEEKRKFQSISFTNTDTHSERITTTTTTRKSRKRKWTRHFCTPCINVGRRKWRRRIFIIFVNENSLSLHTQFQWSYRIVMFVCVSYTTMMMMMRHLKI